MTATRYAFVASKTAEAQALCADLVQRHGQTPVEECDVIVALGGDGFMLQTLHRHGRHNKPVYGMKAGTVGFLMNQYREDDGLPGRIAASHAAILRPLEMTATSEAGSSVSALAYNEVSLLRQTKQ